MNFSRAVGVSDCFSYCTLQCWKMVPGDQPTFTEQLSSLIEQIADYLQMGYNPFIVGGGKGGEKEEEEKVNEEEEKEVGEEEEEEEVKNDEKLHIYRDYPS